MLKNWIKISIVALFGVSLYLVACGQVDPAWAPSGSTVEFVGSDTGDGLSLTYGPDTEHGIPSSCTDEYKETLVEVCKLAGVSEEDCIGGEWSNYEDTVIPGTSTTYGNEIKNRLFSNAGSCGYYEMILTAIVYEATDSTATTTVKTPMNDVELRWIVTSGVLMYLEDDPSDADPLSDNPYYTRTDERGLASIKIKVPLPNQPGIQSDYLISADIGVSKATYKISMVSDDITEETTDDTE